MTCNLGQNLTINLTKLIDTRLLIQANSGGGKSWAIRKLLEMTHGKVHQIVLDIEGDFSSLREKFDFILAGKGGDIAAHPKMADLLSRKVLEMNADIIIDLYELKQHERIRFVRLFLESMIDAPKALWHPVLVIIDEAHIFAPEKGSAESLAAVIDLETRGRKRGYCGVLATQRLSKLHKDAAAECNNKLIGRTGLDIDLKRAGDELGMTPRDALSLRDLEPGEFFCFGPAISKTVNKAKVGNVITKHPKAGARGIAHIPVPTTKIKTVLSKLSDLPKEAEEEIKDRETLRQKIRELERTLRTKPVQKISDGEIQRIKEDAQRTAKKWMRETLTDILNGIQTAIKFEIQKAKEIAPILPKSIHIPPKTISDRVINKPSVLIEGDASSFGQCERKILGFLSMKNGDAFSKVQIGAMTGYRHSSGGFNNALSKLAKAGYIIRTANGIRKNPDADISGLIDESPHTLEDWINKLGACERAIYQKVLNQPEYEFSKDEIALDTGYSAGSGGFNNALSRLNTLGLIKRDRDGLIKLNDEIASI